jgi:hypothetical protein
MVDEPVLFFVNERTTYIFIVFPSIVRQGKKAGMRQYCVAVIAQKVAHIANGVLNIWSYLRWRPPF